MKRKERYIAHLDEVIITREGDAAVIRYTEEGIPTTHLTFGPEVAAMSEETILEIFNETLRSQARLAAEYKYVAVEVPIGSPQIEYAARSDQWVPRGSVVRCLIGDDENGQVVVEIDDHELSLEEFGRMLVCHAGWGMRIEFVPEDEVYRRPKHVVREPTPEEDG